MTPQFRYLNDMASAFIDDGQPVISVDTKKKELIGDYANDRRQVPTPSRAPRLSQPLR